MRDDGQERTLLRHLCSKVELTVTQSDSTYSARFQRNCDERITLQFSGRGLDGNGDVFLEILKLSDKKVRLIVSVGWHFGYAL